MSESEQRVTVDIMVFRETGVVIKTMVNLPTTTSQTNKLTSYSDNMERFFRSNKGIKFFHKINGRHLSQDDHVSGRYSKIACDSSFGFTGNIVTYSTICGSKNTRSFYHNYISAFGDVEYSLPVVTIKDISIDALDNMLKCKTFSLDNLTKHGRIFAHGKVLFSQMLDFTKLDFKDYTFMELTESMEMGCTFVPQQS